MPPQRDGTFDRTQTQGRGLARLGSSGWLLRVRRPGRAYVCFLLLHWRNFVAQVVVVEDRVEDQPIVADGFAAIDGVVAEEQDVALAQMRVDHDGVFGDGAALVEQAIEQQDLIARRSAG